MQDFLDQCRAILGSGNLLTHASDTEAYLTDWRRRVTGKALAVVRPAGTEEVAALVRLCNTHRVPIVPQGGNTGLVLGSIPDTSGSAIVMSLARMKAVRSIDCVNNTMTVEAGCILETLQDVAAEAGRLFPLSMASEGSCTIGGNLATNAGGNAVLRYGNARDLCLGVEVVTPQGEIWNGLRGLRKDNTGYDLRDLYIGAEGTLGIITAATLKLFPQPKAQITALAGMASADDALRLLTLTQTECGAALTAFELMSGACVELVCKHYPQMSSPLSGRHGHYVLLELSDAESEEHAMQMLEGLIEKAMNDDLIEDAVVASSIAQSKSLWNIREHIPLAQTEEGKNVRHDVSVPISCIGDFIRETSALLEKEFPGCRLINFGHLGDGNLHFNVSAPAGASDVAFVAQQEAINRVVHDNVHRFGGSISAEHGLGAMKRDEIMRYKSELELRLMKTIKRAMDPLNLMNPGKLFA